jgi:hypothetical protein
MSKDEAVSVEHEHYDRIQRVLSAALELRAQLTTVVIREIPQSVYSEVQALALAVDELRAPTPRYTVGHECVMEDGKIICHTTGTAAAERICAALTVYEQTVQGMGHGDRMTRDNYERELDRVTRP